jgi:predicted ribosome-associated RNA-binding protein Tma20
MKLRLAIDDMLGRIRFFNDRGFDAYVRSIDSKLTFFEKLKDAIPLLELAIWNAKLVEQSYPSNEDSTIDSKLQHRVLCGADVIIPNVLSFLIG